MKQLLRKQESILLTITLALFGIFYIFKLTASGLWYDEGIEYFYSKYMTGLVPVNVFNPMGQIGSNMYERVCMTFQPPLYNFLMYFWLILFDNETGFRMAGVITTFIGALGFYFAVRRISDYKWGIAALSIYLSTSVIVYYALECGEYNLLLCMECWMLYFFVKCAQSLQYKVSWNSLIGFYLFASLSIYSQYGAAFFIISLFGTLCYIYQKSRQIASLKRLFITGAATFIITIVPLLILFIRVQIMYQGSDIVDHSPVFAGNLLGGIPYSFTKSFYEQIIWIFSTALTWGRYTFYFMVSFVILLLFLTLVSAFSKSKAQLLIPTIIASISSYALFFILSACSFYSYNSWDGALGCYNIIHQTRYVLFFVPLLLFTMTAGFISIYNTLIRWNLQKTAKYTAAIITMIFILNFAWSIRSINIKSDDREITKAWLDRRDFKHKIVVQEYISPTFMFYVQHSISHNIIQDAVILTKQDMRDPQKIESHLRELGVTNLSEFYFIGNKDAQGMKKREGIQVIRDLFTKEGYKVQTICEGVSSLLYISKQ